MTKRAKVGTAIKRSPLKQRGPRETTGSPTPKRAKAKRSDITTTPATGPRYMLRSIQRTFPFFKLPLELRQKILKLVLINEDEIKMVPRGGKIALGPKPVISTSLERSFAKTFLLNRQFYQESVPIAYGMNTFHFKDTLTLSYWLLHKTTFPQFIKKVTFEIDQARKDHNSLSGFIDFWCLLDPQHRNFLAEIHRTLFHLTLEKLPLVENFNVKITTLCNAKVPSRQYYSHLFALLFLHQTDSPERDHFQIDFTVPNPNFVVPLNTRSAPTKNLPKEVRKSIVATSLAVLYLLHLQNPDHSSGDIRIL